MKKKHLCFVINSLEIGGAELSLLKLIDFFKKDYLISVVVLLPSDNRLFISKYPKIQLLELNIRGSLFASIIKLFLFFKSKKPDIIHTWLPISNLLGGILGWISGCKSIIWSIRSSNPFQKGTSFLTIISIYSSVPLSYLIPSKIIHVSNSSFFEYSKIGYSKKRSLVIPNGFSVPPLESTFTDNEKFKNSFGLSSSSFIIGSVGRYNLIKDHKTFIKACLIVLDMFCEEDIYIFIIGRNVKCEPLLSILNNSVHSSKFHFIEEVQDVNLFFKNFDLFCLHSISEGFPNVLAEAMSYRCFCISTDAGDSKLILDNENFIFDKSNVQSLVTMIEKVYKLDKKSKEVVRMNNYLKIKNDYSLSSMLFKYIKLYEKQIFKP